MKNLNELFKGLNFIDYIKDYDETDSTNNRAKEIGKDLTKKFALISTDYQTNGRGRMEKSWEAAKGKDLTFSLLLRQNVKPKDAPKLTMVMGLAVANILNSNYGDVFKIKWPNDIIYEGKKVCGILTEMKLVKGNMDFVIIGTGINCNSIIFSEDIKYKASSIKLIYGETINREQLLKNIVEEFNRLFSSFLNNKFSKIIQDIKEISAIQYKEIYISKNNLKVKAIVQDISDEGELIVKLENGDIIAVSSGEIFIKGIYGF